jgi:hypothetical protein
LEFNFAGDGSAQQNDKLYNQGHRGREEKSLNQGIIVTMAFSGFSSKSAPLAMHFFEESIS